MIELVLLMPLFMLFVFLMIDFGLLMYHYVSVANAVREGARFGAVNCGDGSCTVADVQNRTIARAGGVGLTPAQITVSWRNRNGVGTNSERGDSVVVSVDRPYNFLVIPGAAIPVFSCADMLLEQTDLTSPLPDIGELC